MILFLYLQYKIEAIHNKDYSVVKTFKAALSGVAFSLFSKLTNIMVSIPLNRVDH